MLVLLIWWAILNVLFVPVYFLLIGICSILALIPLNPSRLCWLNLSKRGGYSPFRTYIATVGVWLNYGLYALEALVFWRLGAIVVTNRREYFSFLQKVSQAYNMAESRMGFLFLGGHFSVIEQAGDAMNEFLRGFHHGEINVLAKPARLPVLTWFLDSYRRSRRFRVIWTRKQEQVHNDMKEAMKRGDSVALVADQKPRIGGIFVEFFSEYAGFPFRGVDIVTDFPAACVANNVRRILPGIFRVEFALLPNPQLTIFDRQAFQEAAHFEGALKYAPARVWQREQTEKNIGKEVVEIVSNYVGWLETLIRKSPYQWCWDYRKWSREPDANFAPTHASANEQSKIDA